jgi:DNA-binding response OmpR family regulator
MMPVKNGFEVIQALRASSNKIPIIVLTARTEDDNKILGLELGADDYICKPFNYRELISRVNAQLRRYFNFTPAQKKIYKNGDLTIDVDDYIVLKGEKAVDLNLQEFKLLEIFMSNPGRVYTKEQLYEKAWGDTYLQDDNTLMVHISRLRDKLETREDTQNYIQTIRGLGYRMVKIDEK